MTYQTASYIPSQNPHLIGNPLVEALPLRLSDGDFWDAIANEIEVPDDLDSFDEETREQLASEIMDTVSPTSLYYDIYCDLLKILKVSYKSRNPIDQNTQRWQNQIANETFVRNRTTAPAIKFTGYSGLGKTTMIDAILSLIPPIITHPANGPMGFEYNQIVYIKVNIPGDADLKQICLSIIGQIDQVQGTKIVEEYIKKGYSSKVCISRLTTLCTTHLIGMIIFDEIQNITLATPNAQKLVFTLFDRLANEARVPTIKVGTSKANKLTHNEFTNARRLGVPYEWKNFSKDDEDWALLVEYAWGYQLVKNHTELTTEIMQQIYKLTQGITHCLFFLMEQANIMAIRRGDTKLTLRLLNEVYDKKFSLMKPALIAIKTGKVEAFDDLMGAATSIDGDSQQLVKKLLLIAHKHKLKGVEAKEVLSQVQDYLPEYKLNKTETLTIKLLEKQSALIATSLTDENGEWDLPI